MTVVVMNSHQIKAQSGDHMISQLIERIAIIDHPLTIIDRFYHNRFTALVYRPIYKALRI